MSKIIFVNVVERRQMSSKDILDRKKYMSCGSGSHS
jgi:hypothetical protein